MKNATRKEQILSKKLQYQKQSISYCKKQKIYLLQFEHSVQNKKSFSLFILIQMYYCIHTSHEIEVLQNFRDLSILIEELNTIIYLKYLMINNYSERAIKWMKAIGYLQYYGNNLLFFDEQEKKYDFYVMEMTKSNEMFIFEQLKKYTLEDSKQFTQQFEEYKRKTVQQYMNIQQYEQREQIYKIIEIDNSRISSKCEFLNNQCNCDIEQLFYTDHYIYKSNQNATQSTTNLDLLKRILYIYSRLHPNIGYISGMNYLLAPLIKVIQKEADCYFCFELIMEKQQHLFLQSDNQQGLSAIMNRFDELIKKQEPQIFNHINYLGIVLSHFFVRWFITLFASDFEIEIVIQLWDKMLVKDYQEYQFQIIIEILRVLKDKILKSNIHQFVELISLKEENQMQIINSILNK